jgi:hypothetical protein
VDTTDNIVNLANEALADASPTSLVFASLAVGRGQIIDAFAIALAAAVVRGEITEGQAHVINEDAIAAFNER